MAGIPKVKITFDADFEDLKKGIKGSQAEVETFADKVGDFGKKASIAFAAAAAAGRVWLYNYGLRGGRTIYQGSPLLPVLELVAFFPLSPVCRGVSPGVVLLLSALAAGRPFLAGVLLLRAFEGTGMGKLLVALSAAAACCL